MATAKDPTRARIENIKAELRTISTCTSATVTGLQDLLAGKALEPAQKENVRVKSSQLLSVQSTARRKAGITSTTTTVEITKQTALSLTPRDRYILATEAANTTLKSLADALKTLPAQKVGRSSAKSKTTSEETATNPRRAHAKSASVSHPLKERSVSQAMNSPKKPSPLRRSSSHSSFLAIGSDTGLVATAECARIAFGYLGTLEAVKFAGKDFSELQLDNGILALVGKLVAHGLDSLAIREMRVLKRRLDRYLGVDTEKKEDRPAKGRRVAQQPQSKEKESLASLLDFPDIDRKSPALSIITNLQTYALRVIARTKRPGIIEAAWNHLKLSNPSSPANLIWYLAQAADNHAKAARQLEALAQTILLLCPSISSSEDEDHAQPSPDVVFCLQHLAFKVRSRWWALAKHQGDKEKELLEPFSKCLVAFSRRSTLSPLKTYKVAETLYKDLLESSDGAHTMPENESPSTVSANKTLSSLAQAAGLTDDALRWLGTCSLPESKSSAAKEAARSVRVTAISLEVCLNGNPTTDIERTIDTVLDTLSSGLGGSAAELDSLFMEVSGLRRIATRIISTNLSAADGSSTESLQRQCVRLVGISLHFTTRFIAYNPSTQIDAKAKARYEARMSMVSKLMKSTVDSVLVCCKRSLDSESTWRVLDTLVQDCVDLLRHTEEPPQFDPTSGSSTVGDSHTAFVKFSNAYWTIHSQLRKIGAEPTAVVAAMERSCELLRSRTQTEKELGFLSMKLERLGEALEQLDRARDSRDAYAQCIQTSLTAGLLECIAEQAANHPMQRVFESTSPATTFGRVLKSYQRSFVKYGFGEHGELAFFDDSDHPAPARGAILEWQLTLYLKTLSRNRAWDPALNSSIHALVERLLGLYTPEQFPVRRQRVRLLLLQLFELYPDMIREDLLQPGPRFQTDSSLKDTEDRELARYEGHLRPLLNLKLVLRETTPSISVIRDCFSTWQTLVKAATSWDDLAYRVDDTEYWLQVMQASADYLATKGKEYDCLPVLQLLVQVLELEARPDFSDLVIAVCALGVHFLRLGYTGKAGLAFAKAESFVVSKTTSTEAKLRWHLGYAEYLLKIGNTAKCEEVLLIAQSLAREDDQFMSLTKPSTTLSGRMRFNRILADACYVSSLVWSAKGHHKVAARHARQCVVINRRIWAALETRSNSRKAALTESTESDRGGSSKADFDPLSSMRNDKGMPLAMSVTHGALNGADFWTLAPALYRGLMQHSVVFSNQGLIHEAVYVAEQAEKVAAAINSTSLILENASHRAECWAQSGHSEKAQAILDSIDISCDERHVARAAYYSSLARLHHATGRFDDELATYDNMERLLNDLSSPSYINKLDSVDSGVDALAEEMSAMSLATAKTKSEKPTKATKPRPFPNKVAPKAVPKVASRTTRKATLKSVPRAAPKPAQKTVASAVSEAPSIAVECASLCGLQLDIMHRRVLASIQQDNVSHALDLLDHAEQIQKSVGKDIAHAWARFKALLLQSLKCIAGDFTFNTLPESTVAFPAVAPKERKSSGGATTKRPVISPTTAKASRSKKQAKEEFSETLRDAREYLVEAHALCVRTRSNHGLQQVSAALSHITVLLSAVSGADLRGSLHPLYAAYMSEIPKCNSLRHIQESIEVEHESTSREEYLKWPEPSSDRLPLAAVTEFQNDYVDIIPESWTAVALAINEQHDELYITRYESGTTPFVLRLPMTRHSSRDMDEAEFTFDDGKREFDEIIRLSDFSTRSAKDMTSKEGRLQWWTEREALDTQLHELLINIENIWLGGFKGIFSQHDRQPALLARFRKSFENILNRYLPSRRKKAQQKKSNLDPRVLELFVGLGDASSGELDLDEALMDLIYFVVDVLQFNGERNAYDEIDFDAMVIETHDALRAYHAASQSASSAKAHTILVLDKNLHLFPWESLPCLEKVSISRLPSLAALRERILAARSSNTPDAQPGHYILTATGGTSILNPSGDLSHTLKTLQPRLNDLQGEWAHIVSRAPTEKEFEDSLREKGLLLYFGHGSGAQFVRSKAVRRLYPGTQPEPKPGCATTLLFGCSSAHLSENGIYEPSGMMASYLTAGAPAVVGMLWDVTDKDCDRFAVKAGELWGLWSEPKEDSSNIEPPPTVKKSKGKGKVAQLVEEVESARGAGAARKRKGRGNVDESGDKEHAGNRERRRGVGLDEAVREARDACVLRYLNGAAAVVYGIPVFLE